MTSAVRVAARYLTASSGLVLYHGSQRWDGDPRIVEHRKGQAEHGPGIYMTTSWETARKYSRGGGAVYRMTLSPPRWLEDARLSLAEAEAFVRSALGGGKKARDVTEALRTVVGRTGDPFPASVLVNVFVNRDVASGRAGPLLAAFLVERGIDASKVRQGSEDWVVVFNPRIVRTVERLVPGDVDAPGFAFDLPRVT